MATDTKVKWTPGPWFVVHDELCQEPWNWDICAETPSADKTLVARVRIIPPHGDAGANAKLISKAPEMAELLREAVTGAVHPGKFDTPTWLLKVTQLLADLD